MSKHLFALYLEDYSSDKKELIIKDPLIYHRITRVLRLSENEELIIFNKKFNVLSKIKIIDKKTIILVLGQEKREAYSSSSDRQVHIRFFVRES